MFQGGQVLQSVLHSNLSGCSACEDDPKPIAGMQANSEFHIPKGQ